MCYQYLIFNILCLYVCLKYHKTRNMSLSTTFIQEYIRFLSILDEIEDIYLWKELWSDLDQANDYWHRHFGSPSVPSVHLSVILHGSMEL